jgi:soluble P-type ATPase
MSRYINASDVSKLLGEEYEVYWSTKAENLNIINNIREKYQPNKPITFELNAKTVETIQTLEPVEITTIVNSIQAPEELERTKSLTAKDLRAILDLPSTDRSKKENLLEQYNKKIVIESLNKTKKETVVLGTHSEYSSKTAEVLANVVHPVLKAVLDRDFTMERGKRVKINF